MEELKLSAQDLYHLLKSFFYDSPGCSIKIQCPGNSMSPFIRHESILTLAPYPQNQTPRFGDVVPVAVHRHKKIIIHRIISARHPEYLIKGDNNKSCDGWYHKKDILGVVEKIKKNDREYTPGFLQNTMIAAVSKTQVLNYLILPAARKLRRLTAN